MEHWQINSQAKKNVVRKNYNVLLAGLLFVSLFSLSVPLNAATYKLTFTGLWNGSHVQSNSIPGGAHFTTLIGVTHQAGQPLWEPGALASQGIENVAEEGDTSAIMNEIDAAINAGTARNQVMVDGLSNFPRSSSTTFDIFDGHSSVSFISMIAPSPDWFVGVQNVSLKQAGTWIEMLSLDLHPWDAGTEEGNGFSLGNPATDPQQVISIINGAPFVETPVIANITFELISTPVPLPGTALLLITSLISLVGPSLMRKCSRLV